MLTEWRLFLMGNFLSVFVCKFIFSIFLLLFIMLEIKRELWSQLRDLYENKRTNLTGYDLIEFFIQDKLIKEDDETVKIYTTDRNWLNHGTYILIHTISNNIHIYLNTLLESLEDIKLALNTFKFQIPYLFCGYGERFQPLIEYYWLQRNIDVIHQEHQGTFVYHLSKTEVRKFKNTVSGISFGTLNPCHAILVDQHWTYRSANTLDYIRKLIVNNIGVGAFDKTGQLVAWCLRSPHGSLCNLHVLSSHRRQGLGSLIVQFMAEKLASTNSEIISTVVFNNEKSCKLFEKLGFKRLDIVYWAVMP